MISGLAVAVLSSLARPWYGPIGGLMGLPRMAARTLGGSFPVG